MTFQRPPATRSKSEALDLHEHLRSDLLDEARAVAIGVCRRRGEVHSRDVVEGLELRAALASYEGSHSVLGAVFVLRLFRWTGRWHTYSDKARNTHTKQSKVWVLRDDANAEEVRRLEGILARPRPTAAVPKAEAAPAPPTPPTPPPPAQASAPPKPPAAPKPERLFVGKQGRLF